ncbi:MFS transporter [Streptomyces sp. RB6PN25]|uniref:MFS transporter n=1 Tax=Streptomyces humicola TaxID=2953240 RepID=A0ABT1PTW8_9ACTN|nr:MFS transporter [Streptomyces humicola]MCQ4081119.1 MFS transporter [Streptomyces humicola]
MSRGLTDRPRHALKLDFRFRTFQVSVLGSNLADGIYLVTIPLLALSLTGSALVVSAVGVALRAPWLLLTLPAGVVVDQFPPLTVMRVASMTRLPLVAVLCVLAWERLLPVWGLVTAAFLIAGCGTFIDVAAQSLVPRMVPKPLIPRANANLQSGLTLTQQFAGPALGGVLAAVTGAGIALSTTLYAATLSGLQALQRRLPGGGDRDAGATPGGRLTLRAMFRDLGEGARYFRTRRDLIGLAVVAATGNLAFASVTTMLPLWVVAPARLGLPKSALGFIAAAPAVGGLLAGAVAARMLSRFGGRAVLGFCAPAVGLCFVLIAVPSPFSAFGAMACYGGFTVTLNVMSMSHRQSTIPEHLFGRVNAVYRWIVLGVSPFGAGLGGLVADHFGLAAVFLCAGAFAGGSGVLLPALLFRASPPDPDRSQDPGPDRRTDTSMYRLGRDA